MHCALTQFHISLVVIDSFVTERHVLNHLSIFCCWWCLFPLALVTWVISDCLTFGLRKCLFWEGVQIVCECMNNIPVIVSVAGKLLFIMLSFMQTNERWLGMHYQMKYFCLLMQKITFSCEIWEVKVFLAYFSITMWFCICSLWN